MRGGARPNSGPVKGAIYKEVTKKPRKTKPTASGEQFGKGSPTLANPIKATDIDAVDFLRTVWNDPNIEMSQRIRAAEIVHKGGGPKGKKSEREEKAKIAGSSGKFTASPPPLRVIK